MRLSDPRAQAVLAIACAVFPLLFVLWLRAAIVGLPLVLFFAGIAMATTFAGQIAGIFVLAVSVAAAVIAMRSPPLNFTLGLSLNGLVFIGGYAASALVVYLLAARQAALASREARQTQQVLVLSGALSRWLGRNARVAASLMRTMEDVDPGLLADVARERMLMTARVERLMRGQITLEGGDLSSVMTDLCEEIIRAERRPDLHGEIAIAPMELDHEDFVRLCLVLADLLFLALREDPSSEEPLRISLTLEGSEAVLGLTWLRTGAPSWTADAHGVMTQRVAGRVARSLGGGLHWSARSPGRASSALRFPVHKGRGPAGGGAG